MIHMRQCRGSRRQKCDLSSSEVCEVLRDMSGYGRAVAAKRSISIIMCYASAHTSQRLAWFMKIGRILLVRGRRLAGLYGCQPFVYMGRNLAKGIYDGMAL